MSKNIATYATQAQLRRALTALRKQNLYVGSVLLHPNGAIELRVVGNDNEVECDFDSLEAAGLL